MAERIIPQTVKLFNEGRFGDDVGVFERNDFYQNILINTFSPSVAEGYITSLYSIISSWQNEPNWKIICLMTPNTHHIGETYCIGIIVDMARKKAAAYTMEFSYKDYVIGQWTDNVHLNFGTITSRPAFFQILSP